MNKVLIVACGAVAVGGMGMALAQSGPMQNVQLAQWQPQIIQLQKQIDALKSQVAAQENTIAGMKIQAQKIAIGGFANKGEVTKLESQLAQLAPMVQTLQVSDRNTTKAVTATNARITAFEARFDTHKHNYIFMGQNGDKQNLLIGKSYMPTERCSKAPGGPINCVPGAPY